MRALLQKPDRGPRGSGQNRDERPDVLGLYPRLLRLLGGVKVSEKRKLWGGNSPDLGT